jgi:hypothetical protein
LERREDKDSTFVIFLIFNCFFFMIFSFSLLHSAIFTTGICGSFAKDETNIKPGNPQPLDQNQ